jgi:predicted XRE-type DNA-binding protein
MTVMQTRRPEPLACSPDIQHSLSGLFAELFAVYERGSKEVKEIISSMVGVFNAPKADADERMAALDTLAEILFPAKDGEQFGVDLEDLSSVESAGAGKVAAGMEKDEGIFAANLRRLMTERKVSQKALAEQIDVGQPAISMMLNRHCQPQRATVEKLAKALKVAPKKLWPKF